VAPSTVDRAVPDLFDAYHDVLKDLQERRTNGPRDATVQAAFGKGARELIGQFIRQEAQEAIRKNQPRLAARLNETADAWSGRLTTGQQGVKKALQALGVPNATGREVEHFTQRFIYRTMLGYALDSATKNLFQPTMALLHVSPRNLLRGYRAARTDAGKQLYENLDLSLAKPHAQEDDLVRMLDEGQRGIPTGPDSGAFMRATDNLNRRVVFLAHLAEQGELENAFTGKASEESLREAQRVMRLTQGEPGPLSSNPYLRGPIGGSLKPFTKFPNLVLENMWDAFSGKAKYSKSGVLQIMALMAGGAALGLDLTDVLIGAGNPLGINIMHPSRTQLPPVIKGAIKAGQYITGDKRIQGDLLPASMNLDDILDSDVGYAALGRYPTKVVKTLHNLGGSEDPLSDLASLLGITTTAASNRRETQTKAHELARDVQMQRAAESHRRNVDYERAAKRGDTATTNEIESHLTPAQIRALQRRISRGDLERIRQQLPLADRARFDRDFGAELQQEREHPR
jgi:hypothetical protein